MHAVFLDYETVSHDDLDLERLRGAIERPGEPGELTLYPSTDAAALGVRLASAQIVLTNKVQLGEPELAAAPRLALIALTATGTDNVDLAAAQARGIAVCNVRDYCTASVVQHVWSLILALTQHLPEYRAFVARGEWRPQAEAAVLGWPLRELAGRTLGIVGFGALGRGVAAVAPAFGMQVLIAERPGLSPRLASERPGDHPAAARPGLSEHPASERAGVAAPGLARVPLDALLAAADVVSLHCPLTPATRGLIGERELGLMKRDALLINTARGALIDAAALARALRAGRLGGAGLDVLAAEPPVRGDPLLEPDVPRLIITPHIAWGAREARQRCLDDIAASIEDFRRGGRRNRLV